MLGWAAACDGGATGADGGPGDAEAGADAPGDVAPDAEPPTDVAADDAEAPDGEADSGEPEWPVLPPCIYEFVEDEEIDHEVLQGTGEGGVSCRLWRCLTGQGSGHTGTYRADAFEPVFDGRTYRVGPGDDLACDWTHHNWYDSLVATHPEAILRWRVEAELEGPFELRHFVSAADSTGGALLLPETRVE